jgi:hydroxyacylglutathione hydrolase
MSKLEIHQFPCLSDNYGVLIHDSDTGVTATIDTPEAAPIIQALADTGWSLTHILNTHHHFDHTAGNEELKQKTGCTIVGPRPEAAKIPGIDVAVGEGDTYDFGGHVADIIETPGHTLGHIAYHFAGDQVAFVGDTLFALGCGRVFEGTFEQMWSSMQKLMALPPQTVIYCGHEYTKANAAFAVTIEPDNAELMARAKLIDEQRARGEPTVPTTLDVELRTNPFLRAASPGVQKHLGMENADIGAVFAEVRRRKDNF